MTPCKPAGGGRAIELKRFTPTTRKLRRLGAEWASREATKIFGKALLSPRSRRPDSNRGPLHYE
jgi:hypothetical protein